MRRVLLLALIMVGCSDITRPTLDELREQQAEDISATIASWDCGADSFEVTHIGRGTFTESAALEAANGELRREGLAATDGVRVGSVWWLADDEGKVIAAMSVEGGLSVCLKG